MDGVNLGSRSGSKRVIDEIGGDIEMGDGERLDFDGGVCGKRKVRGFDRIDGGLRACGEVVDEEKEGLEGGSAVGNGFLGGLKVGRNEVEGSMKGDDMIELEKLEQSVVGLEGKNDLSFDLNVSVFDEGEFLGSPAGVQENFEVGDVSAKEFPWEVIDISSSDEAGEEELVVVGDYRGKGKVVDIGASFESNLGVDLDLMKVDEIDTGASGSRDGGSRYTREEKGKDKVEQSWISLGKNSMELDLITDSKDQVPPSELAFNLQQNDNVQQKEVVELDLLRWQEIVEFDIQREQEAREQVARQLAVRMEQMARVAEEIRQNAVEDRRRSFRRFARPLEEDEHRESSENEQKLSSTAWKQNLKQSNQPLIRWRPSVDDNDIKQKRFVPSLLDLSLRILANNADKIVSLEEVPESLKWRFSHLVCDSRKMNAKVLDLFVKGSPEEIRMKDTSWITDKQFKKSFGSFDPKNLKVFQFDLCGQCVSDNIIIETLARSRDSLPGLGIISLRGACRLTDKALKVLVKLAPALCSINLGECSLLTHIGIDYIADALGTSLKELFIDNCSRIDARRVASALMKFRQIEVLSVAGIPNVCDEVISDIVITCGRNIKELDLADCERLTDSSLKIIGQMCSNLHALNIVNLQNLTDTGLLDLANGCKSIRTLKLGRNEFSDKAIAAFIDIAGRSLEELSLNHVRQVGSCTALSLATFSRKLMSLDLSWCRKVTDEALGLIVDSCWSLKLLKIFGCTQITNVFLDGHSNSAVRIIGLNMTSIMEHLGMHEAGNFYLRYSPLPVPCGSKDWDDQDV